MLCRPSTSLYRVVGILSMLLFMALAPFAVVGQDDTQNEPVPAVTYRAYFEAKPVATDGEAALRPFYTRAAVDTLLARVDQEPGPTRRLLTQKRRFFEQARIDQIEMTEIEAAGSDATARLRVTFSAKDPDANRSATLGVIMEVEDGQWKIAHEENSLVPLPEEGRSMRYAAPPYANRSGANRSSASRPGGSGSSSAEPSSASAAEESSAQDCPDARTYGDAEAANQLVLEQDGLTRRIGFEGAAVVLRGELGGAPWLSVRFPAFGPRDLLAQNASYRYAISVDDFDAQKTRQIGDLQRSGPVAPRGFDCFSTTEFSGRPMGTFITERYEAPDGGGRLVARFDTGEDGEADEGPRVRAQIDTRRFVDLRLRPVGDGNEVVKDGETYAAESGWAAYDPNAERLRVELQYRLDSGAPNGALFTITEFPGEPGVYVRDMGFGEMQIAIIDVFDGETGLRGEVRTVDEEDLPDGDLTPTQARQIDPAGDEASGRFVFDATAVTLWPQFPPVYTGDTYTGDE